MKKLPLSGECALRLRKGTKTTAVGPAVPHLSSQAQLALCLLPAKQVTQCVLPGWRGTSLCLPGPVASVSLSPGGHFLALWAPGRDTSFDTNCMRLGNLETSVCGKVTNSPQRQREPVVLISHPHPSPHTQRKMGVLWSQTVMLVRAAPVHVQSRSFRKDGARGGTEAGGCACLWGRPVQPICSRDGAALVSGI